MALITGDNYYPITTFNTTMTFLPLSFNEHIDYSTRRLPQKNVNISSDQGFLICCDCEDDCRDKKRCACWQLTIQSTRGEIGGQVRSKAGYEYRRLQEPVLTGIYECNSKCKCSKTCLNRVVQNPLKLSFQVFKTENRGWGLRSIHDIPKVILQPFSHFLMS